MNRYTRLLLSVLVALLSISCSSWEMGNHRKPIDSTAAEISRPEQAHHVSFDDRTEEVVGHAQRLIEKNQREGAVLDQRWYTLKRFGPHQDVIFSASKIIFYGGLEDDVRRHLANQYGSIAPVKDDQAEGDIRLYSGERSGAAHDLIIIGQNGREVALKTIIRLIYLAKFAEGDRRRKYQDKLRSFSKSLKVFMASHSTRDEFTAFFRKYGIVRPDAVMIGFIGNIRSILRNEGISDPEIYADESLRVNWYPDANGMKVLLVSIDENRIFASRSGALIDAILQLSSATPPLLTFLGSGGTIDEPGLVGKIVTPTIILNGDPFPETRNKSVLVHILRNRAVDETSIRTAHASVENVIVETTQWANQMKRVGVRTVDQELFHVINAMNASAHGHKLRVFVGILVTDNVSSRLDANVGPTLEHAEETISKTAAVREAFLTKVLTKMGVLKHGMVTPPIAREVTR